MEKVVLSKKIQEAINGSKEAEEFLYSHYYECYYDLVEANQSIKNIELIYSESIRESIKKSIERKEKNIPNYIDKPQDMYYNICVYYTTSGALFARV